MKYISTDAAIKKLLNGLPEIERLRVDKDNNPVFPRSNCLLFMRDKAMNSELHATGIRHGENDRVDIPVLNWIDLEFNLETGFVVRPLGFLDAPESHDDFLARELHHHINPPEAYADVMWLSDEIDVLVGEFCLMHFPDATQRQDTGVDLRSTPIRGRNKELLAGLYNAWPHDQYQKPRVKWLEDKIMPLTGIGRELSSDIASRSYADMDRCRCG